MGDWREALRPFLRYEPKGKKTVETVTEKLRRDLRTRFNLSDEEIDRHGGPVRVAQLFLVVLRAVDFARSKTPGRKPFGWAVSEAAKATGVELGDDEPFVLLATVRATLALGAD